MKKMWVMTRAEARFNYRSAGSTRCFANFLGEESLSGVNTALRVTRK